MGKITSIYPTLEASERTNYGIMSTLYKQLSEIPEISGFFDSVELNGDESTTYSGINITFNKGSSKLILAYDTDFRFEWRLQSTTYTSSVTDSMVSYDISVSYAVGVNGTVAIWLDSIKKCLCAVFNKFGETFFIGISKLSYSFVCADTGTTAEHLAANFNGDNIGKGIDYIAQPYYHKGVNTGDIYTFDGGASEIPSGIFKLGNAEFVRLTSNFALRIG